MKNFRITPSLAVILVLVILVSIAALRYDGFLGVYNVQSVMRYNSMFALVALGMCFVIMTGGIDLSVGSVAAMCSVVSALLSSYGLLSAAGDVARHGRGQFEVRLSRCPQHPGALSRIHLDDRCAVGADKGRLSAPPPFSLP